MKMTLLGAALLLLVLWLFVRRRGQAEESAEAEQQPRETGNTAYHAVSIKFEEHACAAAKELTGRRFLSNAAPRLPLPECNALECRCRFNHHNDRRAGKDRRSPFAAGRFTGSTGSDERERRESRDRRKKADLDDF